MDIKEQLAKTKEDLEDLEIYVEDLMSFLPVAFSLLSGIGKIVDVNKAFSELTEFDIMESAGKPVESLFSEKEKIRNLLDKSSEKNKIIVEEFVLLSKNKKKIPVTVSVSARRDKEGNLIGYFFAINDITEFKELQENLEEKVRHRTEELQQRINELEKFRKLTEKRELRMIALKKRIKQLERNLTQTRK